MDQTANNQLAVFQPSDNAGLSVTLNNLEAALENAARQNVTGQMTAADLAAYTQTEIYAAVKVEELRLVKGLDLSAIFLREKLLTEIEDRGLWSEHPNRIASIRELARYVGISKTQMDFERSLCRVIFPYFLQSLNVQPAEIYEQMSKSNLVEIVPVLRVLITGQPGDSREVNNAAVRFADNAAASLQAHAQAHSLPDPTDEEIRSAAIQELVEAGGNLTVRELRNHVRPTPTRALAPTILQAGHTRYFLTELDEDQYNALQAKLGTFIGEPMTIDAAQRNMVASVPLVRTIRNFS